MLTCNVGASPIRSVTVATNAARVPASSRPTASGPAPGGTGESAKVTRSNAAASAVTTTSGVRAAMPFDGVARQAVLSLKFHNRRGVARQLAALMVRRLHPADIDLVTWAPTSAGRAGRRGFDQAELLARAVARELGVPCRRLLYRAHGAAQTGRSRAARLEGPTFRARGSRRSPRVLLVDDVVTSGATLTEVAGVLGRSCGSTVLGAAVAATPRGRRRPTPDGPGVITIREG